MEWMGVDALNTTSPSHLVLWVLSGSDIAASKLSLWKWQACRTDMQRRLVHHWHLLMRYKRLSPCCWRRRRRRQYGRLRMCCIHVDGAMKVWSLRRNTVRYVRHPGTRHRGTICWRRTGRLLLVKVLRTAHHRTYTIIIHAYIGVGCTIFRLRIRPFFGNPAKSGSGHISSRICLIWRMPVQLLLYVQLITDKTNAADLSSGVFVILILVLPGWKIFFTKFTAVPQISSKTGKQLCNNWTLWTDCLCIAADSSCWSNAISFIGHISVRSKNKFSPNLWVIRLWSDLSF